MAITWRTPFGSSKSVMNIITAPVRKTVALATSGFSAASRRESEKTFGSAVTKAVSTSTKVAAIAAGTIVAAPVIGGVISTGAGYVSSGAKALWSAGTGVATSLGLRKADTPAVAEEAGGGFFSSLGNIAQGVGNVVQGVTANQWVSDYFAGQGYDGNADTVQSAPYLQPVGTGSGPGIPKIPNWLGVTVIALLLILVFLKFRRTT